jgi:DNA end-binding protein Ku
MAPRANWKGFLRLSLVTCPVALYPATSVSEKISFNQINKTTGHRIRYLKDADTGEEVSSDDIIKAYPIDKDTYVEMSKDELESIALESTRTIDIDEFVPRSGIDQRYAIRPYYLVPDGKVGHDAYAVIRETIRNMDMVAIGRLVLTSREHIIALEPLKNGLMGTLLRYPYEVRSEDEYFDDIQDVKVTKEMLDLARHIVGQKAAEFDASKFEDRHETALTELINRKSKGQRIAPAGKPRPESNVVDLMSALRQSLNDNAKPAAAAKRKKPKAATGQREMLLPIAGRGAAKAKEQAKEQRNDATRGGTFCQGAGGVAAGYPPTGQATPEPPLTPPLADRQPGRNPNPPQFINRHATMDDDGSEMSSRPDEREQVGVEDIRMCG